MEEAVATNARVCVYDALSQQISLKYPSASIYNIPSSISPKDLVGFFVNNSCAAYAYSLSEVERSLEHASAFCALGLLATQQILNIPLAWPASKNLVGPLSHWIILLNSQTDFRVEYDQIKYTRCVDVRRETNAAPRGRQLKGSASGGKSKGSVAGGVNAGSQGSDGLSYDNYLWTDVGVLSASDTDRLDVGNLAGALACWAFFFVLAICKSLYDNRAYALTATLELVKEASQHASMAGVHFGHPSSV